MKNIRWTLLLILMCVFIMPGQAAERTKIPSSFRHSWLRPINIPATVTNQLMSSCILQNAGGQSLQTSPKSLGSQRGHVWALDSIFSGQNAFQPDSKAEGRDATI
jgi:hypothetical protein